MCKAKVFQDHLEHFIARHYLFYVMPDINCRTNNQATVLSKTFLSEFIDIHRA